MDYEAAFISLCLSMCVAEEYNDREKLKIHNSSMKKLRRLQDEIVESGETEILKKLLFHEDERVRLNAASACLGLFPREAEKVLKELVDRASDPSIAFSARMLLKK